MQQTVTANLRFLEQIHSKCVADMRKKDAAIFSTTTDGGENACNVLFKAMEQYIVSVTGKVKAEGDTLEKLAAYVSAMQDVLRYTQAFGTEQYIKPTSLDNALGAHQNVWKIRKDLKAGDTCDFTEVVAAYWTLWPKYATGEVEA